MSEGNARIRNAPRRRAGFVALVLLAAHAVLLAWVSLVNSPNLDEPAHLASGISHWTFGRFDLYRVNPPLVRMVAAVPVLMTPAETDWSGWNPAILFSRPEFHAGTQFVIRNGTQSFWYFTLARWMCLPLCLVGPYVVYRWGTELYGPRSGLLSLLLYVICPNLIAWGASITPDAAGASLGVLAAFAFWKWLKRPAWKSAILAGAALGLAELTKGTWIILFVLWPALWLVNRLLSTPDSTASSERPPLLHLVAILALAIYLLNLGYGFEGSFQPLGRYQFISRTLSGGDSKPQGGNRFRGTWLELVPVPLPENYVRGLDVQKSDFERKKWSYLNGEQKKGGWWYYYLYAFVLKTPVAVLALLLMACLLFGRRSSRASWRDEMLILVPALVVLGLVSSQTGFSRYLRYALPIFPFVYLHAGRVLTGSVPPGLKWAVAGLLALSTVESLAIYPHSMSYFHTLAGGPRHGPKYLVDANVDWGQDLLFLKRWYDTHPEARPLHLEFFGHLDISPRAAGIESVPVPGYLPGADPSGKPVREGPAPGWFAVSVNHIQGYHHYESDQPKFTYFQLLEPAAWAGYSIRVFHLDAELAKGLRARLDQVPGTTAAAESGRSSEP